jgi:hypothetical protein
MKINCWESKKCGREPGGEKAIEFGVCPAATDTRLDGTHGGKNAGRACWIIAGTLCGGRIQGTFANKFKSCEVCDFYQFVRSSEGAYFQLSVLLLNRMKKDGAPLFSQV